MRRLLVVEDQPNDLRKATDLARAAGFTEMEARSSALSAKVYLEKGLDGELPLPDAIVLDLDLGYESGFELMRFWHGKPQLAKIPLIVWTIMGEDQREICRLFKVTAYVSKLDDGQELKAALGGLERSASQGG
jgi:CheY-like chemotaxis protein